MDLRLAPELVVDLDDPAVASDGFRAWLCGESGSGKSWAAALIAGEWIERGGQVVILDAHAEYGPLAGLAQEVALVGYGPFVPIKSSPAAQEVYQAALARGDSLLFNVAPWVDTDPARLDAFVFPFVRHLYESQKARRTPLLLVVEEAQNFVPNVLGKGERAQVRLFAGIATGGRKFGLSTVFCGQRPSLVDLTVRTQCNFKLLFRLSAFREWKEIERDIPRGMGLEYDSFRRLGPGHAVVLSRWHEDRLVALDEPPAAPGDTPDWLTTDATGRLANDLAEVVDDREEDGTGGDGGGGGAVRPGG